MSWLERRTPIQMALLVLMISWMVIRAGIWAGERWIPRGDGWLQSTGITQDLFRFDAEYYLSIAESGYQYSGDPHSSPNIVFAPLYPILIWLVGAVVDPVTAGFAINKILLFGALSLLILYLRAMLTPLRAFVITLALATSAGAYAFHAFYSESTMLFLLALILWAHQQKRWLLLACASLLIGASRLAALPVCLATSVFFISQWRQNSKFLAYALLCPLGAAIYLAYIAIQFGNPLILLPQVQSASWGLFHPDVPWWKIASGSTLIEFIWAAARKGPHTLLDIKTLNLVWTLLALGSVVHMLRRQRNSFPTLLFTAYFLFVFGTGGGSDYLISAHRFYSLMLPIFLMFAPARPSTAGLLICVNLFYCLLHTAHFNQGIWFYF